MTYINYGDSECTLMTFMARTVVATRTTVDLVIIGAYTVFN